MNTTMLMVAYFYPPRGGGGTQRTVKFAKYLPHFGITPIVLTSGTHITKTFDPSLETTERVIRVPHKELPSKLARLAELFFMPDAFSPWIKDAVRAGKIAAKKNKIDVVYSTASPYCGHVVGMRLAESLHLPWIVDFRDLWTSNALYAPHAPWQRRRHRALERSIYAKASHILATSPTQKKVIIDEFGVAPEKISVITNGFDEEDFKTTEDVDGSAVKEKGAPLTISYLGSFYGKYAPTTFVEALKKLKRESADLAQRVRFNFIGDYDRGTLQLLDDAQLSDVVSVRAYVPHAELTEIRKKTDAFLLYLPPARAHIAAMIPQKVFEYLAARKPILAIVPSSDVADILNKTGGATIVDSGNSDAIARTIKEFIDGVRMGSVRASQADLSVFSRKQLTSRLAQIITSVTQKA
jgi:glycosyltransferase involved in cell wall biosynthesis